MEDDFKKQLLKMHAAKKVNSVEFTKDEYYNLIEELKQAILAEQKTSRQYYILRR
jgi:hypothetical protein